MSKAKTCAIVWLLIFAAALWVTGLTIGIIGAVKWTPLKPFLDNAKSSSCTLIDYEYTPTRCSKWGICLSAKWIVSHPGLRDSTTTVAARVIEKEGLGYNDASKLVLTRNAGDVVSCWIDSRNEATGYFKKPGGGYFAELVIGWVFFGVGTLIWVFFFLSVCGVCSIHKAIANLFSCKCKCKRSSSRNVTSNPLYTSGSVYGNTPIPGTRNLSYSGDSRSTTPRSSRYSKSEAELEVIPPAGAVDYVTPMPEAYIPAGGAGGAGGSVHGSLSSSSSSSSIGDDYGAGAGVAN